jgi:hypothetical protein
LKVSISFIVTQYNIPDQMSENVLFHLACRTTVIYGSNVLLLNLTIIRKLNYGCFRFWYKTIMTKVTPKGLRKSILKLIEGGQSPLS